MTSIINPAHIEWLENNLYEDDIILEMAGLRVCDGNAVILQNRGNEHAREKAGMTCFITRSFDGQIDAHYKLCGTCTDEMHAGLGGKFMAIHHYEKCGIH